MLTGIKYSKGNYAVAKNFLLHVSANKIALINAEIRIRENQDG